MKLIVNGEEKNLNGPVTVSELLEILEQPREGTAVQVNNRILLPQEIDEHRLSDGDSVEIVRPMGGGSV